MNSKVRIRTLKEIRESALDAKTIIQKQDINEVVINNAIHDIAVKYCIKNRMDPEYIKTVERKIIRKR